MRIQKFEDVIAWQKARELFLETQTSFKGTINRAYKDQIFRASMSIMNNIAEGFDRGTDKELRQFLIISRGSAAEVRSMLTVAPDLGYIDVTKQQELLQLTDDISRLLSGFIYKLTAVMPLRTRD